MNGYRSSTKNLRRRGAAAASLIGLLLASRPAAGFSGVEPRIVNGLLTSQYPTTGALLNGSGPDTAGAWCSGTLIGCQTFLTAGHCVADDPTASHYQVFFQHGGVYAVSRITIHPAYNFPVGDVAVLKLATPVTGIAPTPIDTTAVPAVGTSATVVGFGRSGGNQADYGIKRVGKVNMASCTDGVSDTTSVCWNFESPIGPAGQDSDTCNGDSGGPLFVDFGNGLRVAGITSGGNSDTCLPTDNSYDANVYAYRAWIQQQAGADLHNTSCGTGLQIGEPGTSVVSFSGQLSPTTAQRTHIFEVPPNATTLRVAMNAIDDGNSDFDFYVRAGSAPSTSAYDCARIGSNQYGVCEINHPLAGTWYVLVNRSSGAGIYQLTVTKFGIDCSVPGTCSSGATACSASPALACKHPIFPGKALLQLGNSSDNSRDTLGWRWMAGQATSDFGDPTNNMSFALCLYNQDSAGHHLVMEQHIPAGAGWVRSGSGFKYADKTYAAGVGSVVLKPGTDGAASLSLKGKGVNLHIPPLPLLQQSTVILQLVNGQSCWEARYSTNLQNDALRFKATND